VPFARSKKAEAEELLDWLEANGLPAPEGSPFWAGGDPPPAGGGVFHRLAPDQPPMPADVRTDLTVAEAARLFAQLGDPTRLRLLLVLRDRGEACVGELAAALGLSQPNVSAHLMRLRWGKVVECERRGHHVFYRLASPFIAELLRGVDTD
jgi:DNA-binding transcriptional ArsR family regulator